jgi:hypothetical protein
VEVAGGGRGGRVELPPPRGHKDLQRRLRKLLEPMAEPLEYIVDTEHPYRPFPENEVWGADVACVSGPRYGVKKWLEGPEAAHAFQADPWQRTWISSSWPAYWIWICLTDDPETQTTVSTHQVPHLKSAVDETGLQRPDSDRSEPTGDPITPVAASGDCWCDVDPDGWLFR